MKETTHFCKAQWGIIFITFLCHSFMYDIILCQAQNKVYFVLSQKTFKSCSQKIGFPMQVVSVDRVTPTSNGHILVKEY